MAWNPIVGIGIRSVLVKYPLNLTLGNLTKHSLLDCIPTLYHMAVLHGVALLHALLHPRQLPPTHALRGPLHPPRHPVQPHRSVPDVWSFSQVSNGEQFGG